MRIILKPQSNQLHFHRKKDGRMRVFDETFSENESHIADITAMEEKLRNLPLSERDNFTTSSRPLLDRNRTTSSQMSTRSHSSIGEENPHAALPAFIRSSSSHPHTRNLRKADPVAR